MSLKSTINTVESDVKGIYQYLSDRSYFLPENKNIQNIVPTLRGDFAPATTFMALKRALINGEAEELYPIGTELPDTYGGEDNPQIVGTYQTLTINNKDVRACGLVRKYCVNGPAFGNSLADHIYGESPLFVWLNSTYLQGCSADLQTVVSEVAVPWANQNNGSTTMVSGKMHLLSAHEVCFISSFLEGKMWELWKQRTGLSTGSNAANPGRVILSSARGMPIRWWTRTDVSSTTGIVIGKTDGGSDVVRPVTDMVAPLPCCWILGE